MLLGLLAKAHIRQPRDDKLSKELGSRVGWTCATMHVACQQRCATYRCPDGIRLTALEVIARGYVSESSGPFLFQNERDQFALCDFALGYAASLGTILVSKPRW